jgi:hypothetical protein
MAKKMSLKEKAEKKGKTIFLKSEGMNRVARRSRTKKLLVLKPVQKKPRVPIEFVEVPRTVIAEAKPPSPWARIKTYARATWARYRKGAT